MNAQEPTIRIFVLAFPHHFHYALASEKRELFCLDLQDLLQQVAFVLSDEPAIVPEVRLSWNPVVVDDVTDMRK